MKNTIVPLLLALFLTSLPVFYACEKAQEQILVESISVSKTSVELVEGESITLTAKITPSNATNKNISWKSGNPEVATVDQSGKVTAVKAGKSTISVTSEDGGKSVSCVITVKAKVIVVSSVTLNKTSASLKVGETVTLEATVSPSDATDKTVSWSSSNETIAIVSHGVVIAKNIGSATITAKAGDKTASCAISVEVTSVTSISLDQTSASLKVGETITLTATVEPDNATDKTVTWTSSEETIAVVSNGVVISKKVGTAIITAKAGEKTATCTVTVIATPVTSITLNQTSAQLKAGETVTLTATVNPSDATDKTVTWSTNDATVATVANGVVTAKKVGTTTITAKAGDKTATCKVTVEAISVMSIALDKTSVSIEVGDSVTLTATIYPSDATDKTITWSTSDADIASVDSGVVTAHKIGVVNITATTTDGTKTATCFVNVYIDHPKDGENEDVSIEDWD